jgi:hypothetical protein
MNVATRTRLDVIALSKHIGAEIRGIDRVPPRSRHPGHPQTWLDHAVWCFATRALQQDLAGDRIFRRDAPLTRPPKFFPKDMRGCCRIS